MHPNSIPIFSIDSLKGRIPEEKVQVIEPEFKAIPFESLVLKDTGEILKEEEMKKKAYPKEYEGITTRYQFQRISNGRTTDSFLCLLFNSKLLKGRYFEGITIDNVKLVYDEIMSQKVAFFSYEDFLHSLCTDIDFKTDFPIKNNDEMEEIIKQLDELTIPSKDRDHGNRVFRQKDNYGIEWSKRKCSSNAAPYVKVYHKSTELKNNSTEFYEKHIKEMIENLVRLEVTLKNKCHAESLKNYKKDGKIYNLAFDNMELQNILRLSNEDKYQMAIQILGKHIEGIPIMKTQKEKTMNPIDRALLNLVNYLHKKNGLSLLQIIKIVVDGMDKRNAYSYKKKIEYLFKSCVDKKEFETQKNATDIVLTMIGRNDLSRKGVENEI